MSSFCSLCGEKVSFPSGVKCADGCFCKKCALDLPESFPVRTSSVSETKQIIQYERNVKKDTFGTTASYGKVYLDEMRGYLSLADHHEPDGTPASPYETYALSDIGEIGMYPVKPRMKGNHVLCDVELACLVDPFSLSIKKIVKENVICQYHSVSPSKVEWSEPGDLSLFRSMVEQAAKTSVERIIRNKFPTLSAHEVDLFQAVSALYLPEGYGKKDVEDHCGRILSAFSDLPDPSEREAYQKRILFFRDLILNEISGKEKVL